MPYTLFAPRAFARALAAFRLPRPRPRPEPVATLEPRRMLANFLGTAGDDVFRIFGRLGAMHVVVNGVDHATAEDLVAVSSLGGADRVYLGAIEQTGGTVAVTLNLGDGNDHVTNFDPDTNAGTLEFLRARNVSVHGGPGLDSVGLDDGGGPVTGRTYVFDNADTVTPTAQLTYTHGGNGPARVRYDEVEEFLLDAGHGPDSVSLNTKPAGTNLAVTTGGGDDSVSAGGGEFDRRGWAAGTATVFGGAGNDSIAFDDGQDQTSTGESPASITLAGFTVSKGPTGFTYSAFEDLTLSPAFVDRVNVAGPSSFVSRLTVHAGFLNNVALLAVPAATTVRLGNHVTVNVGDGNLSALGGAVTLVPEPAVQPSVLNINDQAAAAGHTHTLTAAGYTRAAAAGAGPVVVNYTSGLEQINVNAGAGGDLVVVASSPPGVAVSAVGNGGNDSLFVGIGRLADVGGPVSLDGGPGTDEVRFNDSTAAEFTTSTVTTAAYLAAGGTSHAYTRAERVTIALGQGGSRTLVSSFAGPLLSVVGGAGPDAVAVGGGDLDSNLAPGSTVYFDGNGGADVLEYDDRLDPIDPLAGPDDYTLDARRVPIFDDLFFRYDRLTKGPPATPAATVESLNVEQRVLLASDDASAIRVLDAGTGLRVEANGGDDAVSVHDTAPGSPVVVHTGTGVDALDVNTDLGSAGDVPAAVLLARSDAISGLTVRSGGTLRVGPGAVLTKASSPAGPAGPFALFGVIDLAGGAMVFQGGTAVILDTLRAAVRAGFNGGAWNGTTGLTPDGNAAGAIHSSLAATSPDLDAVGLVPAAALYRRPTLFMGQVVAPGDVLLRHTLVGDTDLNLRVNALDVARARWGMAAPFARWDQGDFNFDTRSDARDHLLLRRNHGRLLQLPPPPV